MKITESTNRRLIISERKINVKLYELASIQLVMNLVLAICCLPILAISNWSVQLDLVTKTYISMCFSVNLALAIFFYLENSNEAEIISHLFWSLTIYFIPILGVCCLCGLALDPPTAYLAFDIDKNIFTVKKIKFLHWDSSEEYSLYGILEASLDRVTICYGSGIFSEVNAIRMSRKLDGKVFFFRVSTDREDISLVRAINAFLSLR
jgi:nitrate reductase NapE component